jgi:hypothetical protein
MTNFSIILLGVFRKRLMQYEAIKKRRLVIQAGFFPNNAQKRSVERRILFFLALVALPLTWYFSFATAGHRLPGDLIFTLLSGLIATASRRASH